MSASPAPRKRPTAGEMMPTAFIAKRRASELKERSASQEHFRTPAARRASASSDRTRRRDLRRACTGIAGPGPRRDDDVGFEQVAWFKGGLFDDDTAPPLDRECVERILMAAALDCSEIDSSILGTLFEPGLDPDKRSQLGAHCTDRDKIMRTVEPVGGLLAGRARCDQYSPCQAPKGMRTQPGR